MNNTDENFINWFAGRLKQMRNDEGMTQKEFAESCGIGSATYERLEQGRFSPRVSTCLLIARQLGISLSTLYSGFEDADNGI